MSDLLEQKKQFAIGYLKEPANAFKLACAVLNNNVGEALIASSQWPNDPDVLKFMAEAVADCGELHFLPSKAELARQVYNMGADAKMPIDDRLKALRLYADIMGHIDKQGNTTNVNVLTTDKVMVVRDHGSADDWEKNLAEQQGKLIDAASAPRLN